MLYYTFFHFLNKYSLEDLLFISGTDRYGQIIPLRELNIIRSEREVTIEFFDYLMDTNLIDGKKIIPFLLKDYFNQVFGHHIIDNFTLEKLIVACKLMIKLKLSVSPNHNFQKNGDFTLENLDSVKDKFTDEEFKSMPLSKLIVSLTKEKQDESKLEMLKKLFIFYHSDNHIEKNPLKFSYYLYFGLEFDPFTIAPLSTKESERMQIYQDLLLAFNFAQHSLIEYIFKCYDEAFIYDSVYRVVANEDYPDNSAVKPQPPPPRSSTLATSEDDEEFEDEEDEDESFEDDEDYNDDKPKHLHGKMNPLLLFHLLILNDDIELVSIAIKEFGGKEAMIKLYTENQNHFKNIETHSVYGDIKGIREQRSLYQIHRSIKSIKMLDYLFENLQFVFTMFTEQIGGWYALKRFDLLERFETLIGYGDETH